MNLLALLAAAALLPSAPEPSATLKRGDAYAHLIEARMALQRGRALDVVREVRDAAEILPGDAALLAEGAGLLASAGRRSEAESMARRAIEAKPGQLTALRVLADVAAAKGSGPNADPEARAEAVSIYERLLREDPEAPPEINMVLTRLYLQGGNPDAAVESARRYAGSRPGDSGPVRLLAETLIADDKPRDAFDVLAAWIAANPDDDSALGRFADLTRDLDLWERAVPLLGPVVAAQPDNATLLAFRGEARLRSGDAAGAVADLEAARARSRSIPFLRFHLATAYGATNRLADATETARAVVQEFPANPLARTLLAESLSRQGDVDGALEEWRSALQSISGREPENVERRDEVRRRIASLELAAGRQDDAAVTLSGLETPASPDSLDARAGLALERGDLAASRELAKTLRGAGDVALAAMIEGEAAAKARDAEVATERFREASATFGERAFSRGAFVLREAGLAEAGERLLRDWVAGAPDDGEAHFRLGAFLEREGRLEEAEKELREAIRLRPRDAEALNYLGYSLIDRNVRVDDGVALVRRALAEEPYNGAYLDSLGWGLYRQKRLSDARDALERAARELPFDATVLDHLGDVLVASGDKSKAAEIFRRALAAKPDDPEPLRRKLDALGAKAAEAR